MQFVFPGIYRESFADNSNSKPKKDSVTSLMTELIQKLANPKPTNVIQNVRVK